MKLKEIGDTVSLLSKYISGDETIEESDKLYDSNNRKYISDDPQMDGMLLFSCNSLGKSSYMKSVGLSVILAQMGMFVPAKKFNYYP